MKKQLCVVLVSAFLLSGCATGQAAWKPEYREKVTSRTYSVSYEKAIDATTATFEAGGFPIKKVDRENGIIETGDKTMGGPFGGCKAQIYARISKIDADNTKITLSLHNQTQIGFSALSNDAYNYGDETINEKEYNNVFTGIEKRLK